MPSKPSQPATASKVKVHTGKGTAFDYAEQQHRMGFVAVAVFAAVALVSISFGMIGYHKHTEANVGLPAVASVTAGQGVLFLQSSDAKQAQPGATVNVAVYENSGNQPVNVVQGAIKYSADKLQIVSVKTASSFPEEAATDISTPGLIRLARSVSAGSTAIKGAKPVATLEFKVLDGATIPMEIGIDQTASLLVRSTDNKNILHTTGTIMYKLGQ